MLLGLGVLGAGWVGALTGHPAGIIGNLITATIAAASLVYSLGRGQAATRDQYTLTLVARRFDGGDYAENVRILSDLGLAGTLTPATSLEELRPVTWCDAHDSRKGRRAAHALFPILNYWEHVCTAYVDDRINRRLFEDLVQDLIRELVGRYPRIIGDMRREDPDNMEHLCAVWFILAPEAERMRLAHLLSPAPQRLCADDKWRWEIAARAFPDLARTPRPAGP